MQNTSTEHVEKRAYTLREVAAMVGRSYFTIHRAAVAGKLKTISGFGVRMVSDKELERFLGQTETRETNPKRIKAGQKGDAQ